jgi:putative transposase
MRYSDSIFGHLLKPIVRRRFDGVVDSHDGNAYDKEFDSWDHLVVLIYAQLSGIGGLRGLEAVWNANSHHHYHLGVGEMRRSTLSDANRRRPLAVFTETFSMLSGLADRMVKREGQEMLRLIDSSPVPLGQLVKWAKWNGRIRGLKLHVVYDPVSDNPVDIAITHANVNDVAIGEQVCIEAGHTYVFDKAYCKYQWWTGIHEARAIFVTRQKASARFRAVRWLPLRKRKGDGFTMPRSGSSAKAIPSFSFPCAAFASGATRAQRSRFSPTTLSAPPSKSRHSTKSAGRSNCCFAGSSSI